ncbi:cytidine deaminase [Posidoniimonas corsicana]|uniref:Cytidine deaminase n=1 Tax=Posidoniimonas corsicana TaxID=1938618 RepID=A0A5C5V6A3_9BACT|nr:cytidine deaminase [Posidoniimonas corsicana]TWT34056.1 cytidine deaminase [Posidoniimonas corsicana]
MALDQELVDAAIAQAAARFPAGNGGAAALRLADGQILTSVCLETPNEAVNLCHETGAICEAYRRKATVAASVCVSREAPDAPFLILTPCGVCQERLATWGPDVVAAVPAPGDATRWQAKTLRELQPHYWRNIFL